LWWAGDLLGWLLGLWWQLEGKLAVVLVDQWRIGKTSLLNKIGRAGLPGTELRPPGAWRNSYTFSRTCWTGASPMRRSKPFCKHPERSRGRHSLLMLDEADLNPQALAG